LLHTEGIAWCFRRRSNSL